MNNLVTTDNRITAMSDENINKVHALESEILKLPQLKLMTGHILHGGMYARTMMFPAGSVLTGAILKRATLLIISGEMLLFVGDKTVEVNGYHIFAASARRKQAGVAKTDTWVTMIFATEADSVEKAEDEGTDDSSKLFSRNKDALNSYIVTGEK